MRFEGIGRTRLESGARIELAVAGCNPAALPLGYPDSGSDSSIVVVTELKVNSSLLFGNGEAVEHKQEWLCL